MLTTKSSRQQDTLPQLLCARTELLVRTKFKKIINNNSVMKLRIFLRLHSRFENMFFREDYAHIKRQRHKKICALSKN